MSWKTTEETPPFNLDVEFEAHGVTYIGHRVGCYTHVTWWINGQNKGYLENFITRWRYKT